MPEGRQTGQLGCGLVWVSSSTSWREGGRRPNVPLAKLTMPVRGCPIERNINKPLNERRQETTTKKMNFSARCPARGTNTDRGAKTNRGANAAHPLAQVMSSQVLDAAFAITCKQAEEVTLTTRPAWPQRFKHARTYIHTQQLSDLSGVMIPRLTRLASSPTAATTSRFPASSPHHGWPFCFERSLQATTPTHRPLTQRPVQSPVCYLVASLSLVYSDTSAPSVSIHHHQQARWGGEKGCRALRIRSP